MAGPSKTVYWKIGKATQVLTLNPLALNLTVGQTQTVTASWLGTGTLSATSSNPAVATVSVSGTTITVRAVSNGTVVLTASVSESSRYEAASQTVSVSVSAQLEIVYLPTQTGSLTYNGNSQSPTWNSNYNSAKMTLSGTTSSTNAGTYSATFTPKVGYQWSDGTTSTKMATWVIGKTYSAMTIRIPARIEVGETVSVSPTYKRGDGAITVTTSNNNVSASWSGNALTLTGVNEGTTDLRLDIAETTNYESDHLNATVTVESNWECRITNNTGGALFVTCSDGTSNVNGTRYYRINPDVTTDVAVVKNGIILLECNFAYADKLYDRTGDSMLLGSIYDGSEFCVAYQIYGGGAFEWG